MTTFTQHTLATAPTAAQPTLRKVEQALGFIPGMYATLAESPAVLEGYVVLDAALAKGELSALEREMTKLAVSLENNCPFCVAAHSTLLDLQRAAPELVDAVRAGTPLADSRLQALVTFTRAVVRERGFVPASAVDGFLAAGYSKAAAFEVIGTAGLKSISNYVDHIAHVPLDAALQKREWQPRRAVAA